MSVDCQAPQVTSLQTDASGAVVGVEWTDRDGGVHTEHGPVILTTGGFGADFSDSSLLAEARLALIC